MDRNQIDESGTTKKALSAVKPIVWTGAGALLALLVVWLAGGF